MRLRTQRLDPLRTQLPSSAQPAGFFEPWSLCAGTVRQGQHREENRNGNAVVGDVINWLMKRKRGESPAGQTRGRRLLVGEGRLPRLTSAASDVDQRGPAERSGPWWINYHYPRGRNGIVCTPPNFTFAVTGYRARATTHFCSPVGIMRRPFRERKERNQGENGGK